MIWKKNKQPTIFKDLLMHEKVKCGVHIPVAEVNLSNCWTNQRVKTELFPSGGHFRSSVWTPIALAATSVFIALSSMLSQRSHPLFPLQWFGKHLIGVSLIYCWIRLLPCLNASKQNGPDQIRQTDLYSNTRQMLTSWRTRVHMQQLSHIAWWIHWWKRPSHHYHSKSLQIHKQKHNCL